MRDPRSIMSRDEAREWCEGWLLNPPPADEMAAFLTGFRDRGETPEEVAGVVDAVWAHRVPIGLPPMQLDCCGTGGSGHRRFNVSTVVAMGLASMGISVAKHGNKGSRQPNGSMDFLMALGLDLMMPEASLARMATEYQVVFLYARRFHPLLANVAPARALMTGRSVFNLVGPLCNPAMPSCQMIGCPSRPMGELMAHTMAMFPHRKGWVVVGGDGSDDFSLTHPTTVWEVAHGRVRLIDSPPVLGCHHPTTVGDAIINRDLFLQWLRSPALVPGVSESICLPMAGALVMMGHYPGWATAIEAVQTWIESGQLATWYQAFQTDWGLYDQGTSHLE